MSSPFKFPFLILLAAAWLSVHARVEAQEFDLSASSSSSSILVSNSLTYTIYVTNLVADLQDVVVTNALPGSVQILSASSSLNQGSITNDNGIMVFDLGALAFGSIVQLAVNAEPTVAGLITNTVTAAYFYVTNTTVTTNVVVDVTNVPPTQVDLGVSINGPAQTVVTNDLTGYDVVVTNAGPSAASGVALTNTLPAGLILKGASQAYTASGSNMIFSLGTLASGSLADVRLSIEPTNVAMLTLSASVGASGVLDTNTANNTASNSLNVIAYLPGTLLAVTNSSQTMDRQNGLEEQSILVTNQGLTAVPAVRLVVSGLNRQLFNAVGTNNVNPFVIYGTNLPAGGSVNLLLQYNPRGTFTFTNGQLQAFAVPAPNWTPPPVVSTSTNFNLSRIVPLTNGNVLIEFPAVSNRTYTVVYSDNVLFSNAMIAPPAMVAPANQIQWIDYGPPTTLTAPTNVTTRFYRVFQNP